MNLECDSNDNGSGAVQKTSGWVFMTLAVAVPLGFGVWSTLDIYERLADSPYLGFAIVAKIGTSSGFWGCLLGLAAGAFEKNPLGYLSLFFFVPLFLVGLALRVMFFMIFPVWF